MKAYNDYLVAQQAVKDAEENTKVLPQTGDKQNNNTTVGAILVGLGSLLGLGALGKRKED
ncbi:LPXTG cell wall anchor domain-containing protein [Ligilactobacillus salivarius]|uniref:LPXTG cell wall anchor domain-containing protein n=1 Tax=Ligilactobacillus salivarius TaxID=1624 RepID=UPI0025A49ACD|nr:LPXTG cell wall anchor domain-containing protein [Ligilactobacillus salivarius]MDM8272343.1 LPXTG cell wall anchor domain-containing protein [Ligilactobacillus salivarius]